MFSTILKYTLGFFLAIAILVGSGFAGALYLMNRTSILPEKPVFNNDKPSVKAKYQKEKVNQNTSATVASTKKSPKKTPNPTKTPDSKESPESLPPGAYKARVTWPQGLSMRESSDVGAKRIGGVAFNRKVIVLEQSPDKAWQRIRIDGSKQEGWVKAGNTKAIDE
ncbi:MAG: SH3 domain-containing protein [Calothrix sp. MO_192.B10]|nr:SH3 domain-containing protein [Calothrix sp. MO_192.B10]